jgi:hemerythrin-like domain-containing protein
MRHPSLQIIREEHQALTAMLRSISLLVDQHRTRGTPPAFEVLRAMLFYIDEFPERLHHRKESELFFPLIRDHRPDAAEVLDRLDRDHSQGEKAIRELEHALLAWEFMGDSRRSAFEEALARYQGFYLAHMRQEEEDIIPLALEVLTEADWRVLDEAFAENRDPLTGHAPQAQYERLFSKIVNSAPAPVGLG